MTLARTHAVTLLGLRGAMVEVEADITPGLPAFILIGLPDASLSEARDRVRSAALNSGCPVTGRKLVVGLSPADLPKHGAGFDLAIAVASLAAAGDVSSDSVAETVHLGELGLDGRLRPIAGVLPAVLALARAGHRRVMVPTANREEAELVPDVEVVAVSSLREAAIRHGGDFEPVPCDPVAAAPTPEGPSTVAGDLAEVVGNEEAVRALVAAAAGGHHLFLLGPPGAGKTMLAERLPGLLPDLGGPEALEATSIRSLAGESPVARLVTRPPFEAPHHTASAVALLGGGSSRIRPGAAVRASHGVLFLDEAPEFSASALDALRQPLESGTVSIHRARSVAHFPGRFQLVLAANPCPCGGYGAEEGACACPPNSRRRYLGKLSGPLLDRIDIRLEVRRMTAAALRLAGSHGLGTERARALVAEARDRAATRLESTPWRLNAQLPGPWLRSREHLPPLEARAGLDRPLERGALTMRGYDRVLRLAWSVADLDGVDRPGREQVGQALYLRRGGAA